MEKSLKDHPWFWSAIIAVAVVATRIPFMAQNELLTWEHAIEALLIIMVATPVVRGLFYLIDKAASAKH